MELKNAACLITGGSKGIGLGLARALAARGARLTLCARGAEALEAARTELEKLGAEVQTLAADVGEEADAERVVAEAVGRWGRLDLLVNNAGVGASGPVEEIAVEDWDRLFRTNVRGPFLLTRQAVPHFKRQGGGTIVNVSSLAGKNPVPNMAAYAASKWALDGFTQSILGELRRHDIRVVLVHPGSTASEFGGPVSREKQERILQPDDIAAMVVTALALPDRAMVSEIDLRPTNK